MTRELTEANWDTEVNESTVPVVIDFWAPSCIPCRRVEPVIRQLDERFHGRVNTGRLDVEASPRIAASFQVLSVPTVLVVHRGQPVGRVVGVPKLDRLVALVEPHVRS